MKDCRGHRRHPAKFALLLLVIAVVMTFLVMLLWHALIPERFGLKSISFWYAPVGCPEAAQRNAYPAPA